MICQEFENGHVQVARLCTEEDLQAGVSEGWYQLDQRCGQSYHTLEQKKVDLAKLGQES